jgi:hypothetical protein
MTDEPDDPEAPEAPEPSTIDHAFLRSMTRTPMPLDEWQAHLRAHAEFLDGSPTAVHAGAWMVLSVSGLPLAVWNGPSCEAGTQLNLNLANLQGLPLEWACLACAGMPGVMAEGQSFRGVDLTCALLTDALLDGADFSLARLERADLSRASLRRASFRKAILTGTDFERCDLRDADLRGAQLRGARFDGALTEGARGLPQGVGSG